MKMRNITLLLALVLCVSAVLPVNARATQSDPLVLETKEDSAGFYRYAYDPDGRLLYEERNGSVYEEIWYAYGINNSLANETVYQGGNLREEVYYDDFGNMLEHWYYTTGNVGTTQFCSGTPEYDEYGRLVWYTTAGPYEKDGDAASNFEVKKIRYEYDDSVTLSFGHYEQDGNTANGLEPIEWEVLDTDGENLLLISKYALDSRVYHSKNADISWKDSDLRSWLNGEFLETAFSYAEYYQMRSVELEKGLQDWIFLLSAGEVLYYYPGEADRICEATPYAVKRGAYVNNTTDGSWWLLRSPGTASQSVASVNSDGIMDYEGGKVASKRGTVRPVLWVSKTAMTGNCTPVRKHEWLETYENGSTSPTYTLSRLSTYNDEGILIYEQMEDNYVNGWQSSHRTSYDDSGNITDRVESMRMYGGQEELTYYTYENTYDKAGRLTKQQQRIEGAFYGDYRDTLTQYRYNNQGNVIARTEAFLNGKKWETYVTEAWTYDRYGNLLKYSLNGNVEEEYTYVPLSQAQWS